jgi:hypothetical protein
MLTQFVYFVRWECNNRNDYMERNVSHAIKKKGPSWAMCAPGSSLHWSTLLLRSVEINKLDLLSKVE